MEIMRETKNQVEQTDHSMISLKLKHEEYNYVIANLTKTETKEVANKQKMEDNNSKLTSLK